MSSDINHINIIGRLTKDPELRYTQAGTPVASFSIANNRAWKDANGNNTDQVSFFNCVAWNKLGEVITQWVKKGHRIALEGRIQQRSWQDQNGNNRQTVEIVVENMQFLQPRDESPTDQQPPAPNQQPQRQQPAQQPLFDETSPFSDDEIPF